MSIIKNTFEDKGLRRQPEQRSRSARRSSTSRSPPGAAASSTHRQRPTGATRLATAGRSSTICPEDSQQDVVRQRGRKTLSLSQYKAALLQVEGKIFKSASLELELMKRAMLLREKKQRLMLSRQAIIEQIQLEKGNGCKSP